MTPAYDGSRTPSHQPSASWDPTVANTPAHSTAHFDDEFDSMGFGGAATPAGSRYGGATPAMSKNLLKFLFLNSLLFIGSAATPRADLYADYANAGQFFHQNNF
jgi:hypothetical protein